MLAVAATAGGGFALRELAAPEPPPGGVLVRVRLCGLCGSDAEKLRGGGAADGTVLGHELTGEVVAGALPAGTRVAVAHHVPCGTCALCAAGHEPLCPTFLASALDPGGFCELTAASEAHVGAAVLALPDEVSDLAGTFVEPLACVLRGLEAVPRGRALVAGAGSIGLLALQALRARGDDARVLEVAPARATRAAALGFGAPARGERFAGALVTAPAAIGDALSLLDDGGALVVFAGGAPRTLDVDRIYRRELRLQGARSSTPRHLREALALLGTGAIEVESLVDAVLPLERFADGLAGYREGRALKVVFAP